MTPYPWLKCIIAQAWNMNGDRLYLLMPANAYDMLDFGGLRHFQR